MILPPMFASEREYVARRVDVDFWWLNVIQALSRHGLVDADQEPVPGTGPTYPTFAYGDMVVKLFGYRRWWRNGYAVELFASSAH